MMNRPEGKSVPEKSSRAVHLPERYGITSKRFIKNLEDMTSALRAEGIVGTFPTTATVLTRHVNIMDALEGMEIAIHGRSHIDLTLLSESEQEASVRAAVGMFRKHGIHAVGFRAPYLRCNDSLMKVV